MENHMAENLTGLAAGGDESAFERLISENYTTVYRVAYKWCGIKEDAEDVAQEVFIKVAKSLEGFRGASSFRTWLYRIAVNTAKDYIRTRARKNEHEEAFAREASHNPGGGDEDRDAARKLHLAVTALPAKLRDAVILVFSEGLSHKEAAEVLGCAETTVSWRVFQARGKLRKYLESEV